MAPSSTKSPAPARDYPGALVVPQQRATHDPATMKCQRYLVGGFNPFEKY